MCVCVCVYVCVYMWMDYSLQHVLTLYSPCCRVTGGELFEDIVAREYYSEADAGGPAMEKSLDTRRR